MTRFRSSVCRSRAYFGRIFILCKSLVVFGESWNAFSLREKSALIYLFFFYFIIHISIIRSSVHQNSGCMAGIAYRRRCRYVQTVFFVCTHAATRCAQPQKPKTFSSCVCIYLYTVVGRICTSGKIKIGCWTNSASRLIQVARSISNSIRLMGSMASESRINWFLRISKNY